MKKNRTFYIIIFSFLLLTSCSKTENDIIDKNEQLFNKYDGTYPIVSAYLQEAMDLNFDGQASNNLLSEIPDIIDSDLQIYISKHFRFLIVQWAEQYSIFDNSTQPYFIYAKQGPYIDFELNENETQFIYGPLDDPGLSADKTQRFASPIKLTILNDGSIKAILSKKFHTLSGEQEVIVEAIFKKDPKYDRVYTK